MMSTKAISHQTNDQVLNNYLNPKNQATSNDAKIQKKKETTAAEVWALTEYYTTAESSDGITFSDGFVPTLDTTYLRTLSSEDLKSLTTKVSDSIAKSGGASINDPLTGNIWDNSFLLVLMYILQVLLPKQIESFDKVSENRANLQMANTMAMATNATVASNFAFKNYQNSLNAANTAFTSAIVGGSFSGASAFASTMQTWKSTNTNINKFSQTQEELGNTQLQIQEASSLTKGVNAKNLDEMIATAERTPIEKIEKLRPQVLSKGIEAREAAETAKGKLITKENNNLAERVKRLHKSDLGEFNKKIAEIERASLGEPEVTIKSMKKDFTKLIHEVKGPTADKLKLIENLKKLDIRDATDSGARTLDPVKLFMEDPTNNNQVLEKLYVFEQPQDNHIDAKTRSQPVTLEIEAYMISKPKDEGVPMNLKFNNYDERDAFIRDYKALSTNKAYLASHPEFVARINALAEANMLPEGTIFDMGQIRQSAGEAYNSYRKLLVLADNLGAYTEEFSRVVGRNSLTQEELPLSAEITRRRNKLNINAQAWSAISNTNHIISTSATSLMQSQQMRYNSVAQYSNEMQHVMTTMMGAVAQSVQDNISGITNSMRDMLNSVMETLRSAYQVMQQATNAR
jgi:hypothetical protein